MPPYQCTGLPRGRPLNTPEQNEARAMRFISPGNHAIQKLSWWHESIVDWMVMNPDQSLAACAISFNVSPPWLSRIINSGVFKERLAHRRESHSDNISHTLIEKIQGLAELGIEALTERIATERDTIPLPELRAASELALNAMGYSPKVGPGVRAGTPSVQINIVSSEALTMARQAWQTLSTLDPEGVPALEAPQTHESPAQIPQLEASSGTGTS